MSAMAMSATAVSAPELLLLRTGLLSPPSDADVTPILSKLSREQIDTFIESVIFHRVVPQVIHNMTRLSLTHGSAVAKQAQIVSRLAPWLDKNARAIGRHERAITELAALRDAPRLIAIKGLAFNRYYATSKRHFLDVDFFVACGHFWELFSFLLKHGFRTKKVRFGRYKTYRERRDFPDYYGICPMAREYSDGKVYFDIHLGAFPACGEGLVRVDDHELLAEQDVWIPRAEKMIVISCAHAVRQGFCRLRDINDLYALLQTPGLDWDQLNRSLKNYKLDEIFAAMRRLMLACYPVSRDSSAQTVPSTMTFDDRALLLEQRTKAQEFTDNVRFLYSRLWQVRYLYKINIQNRGCIPGLIETAVGSTHLFRTGRPYQTWQSRQVGNLPDAERFVMYPIACTPDAIDADLLSSFAIDRGYSFQTIRKLGMHVINHGKEDELIVRDGIFLVQCNYAGDRFNHSGAARLLAQLNQAVRLSQLNYLEPS